MDLLDPFKVARSSGKGTLFFHVLVVRLSKNKQNQCKIGPDLGFKLQVPTFIQALLARPIENHFTVNLTTLKGTRATNHSIGIQISICAFVFQCLLD